MWLAYALGLWLVRRTLRNDEFNNTVATCRADFQSSKLLSTSPAWDTCAVAFTVVRLLAEGKEMNTSQIAKAAGRSVSRVSNILGALRLAEVVRYQTEGTRARYRLKHPRETRKVLDALSGFVKSASPTHR